MLRKSSSSSTKTNTTEKEESILQAKQELLKLLNSEFNIGIFSEKLRVFGKTLQEYLRSFRGSKHEIVLSQNLPTDFLAETITEILDAIYALEDHEQKSQYLDRFASTSIDMQMGSIIADLRDIQVLKSKTKYSTGVFEATPQRYAFYRAIGRHATKENFREFYKAQGFEAVFKDGPKVKKIVKPVKSFCISDVLYLTIYGAMIEQKFDFIDEFIKSLDISYRDTLHNPKFATKYQIMAFREWADSDSYKALEYDVIPKKVNSSLGSSQPEALVANLVSAELVYLITQNVPFKKEKLEFLLNEISKDEKIQEKVFQGIFGRIPEAFTEQKAMLASLLGDNEKFSFNFGVVKDIYKFGYSGAISIKCKQAILFIYEACSFSNEFGIKKGSAFFINLLRQYASIRKSIREEAAIDLLLDEKFVDACRRNEVEVEHNDLGLTKIFAAAIVLNPSIAIIFLSRLEESKKEKVAVILIDLFNIQEFDLLKVHGDRFRSLLSGYEETAATLTQSSDVRVSEYGRRLVYSLISSGCVFEESAPNLLNFIFQNPADIKFFLNEAKEFLGLKSSAEFFVKLFSAQKRANENELVRRHEEEVFYPLFQHVGIDSVYLICKHLRNYNKLNVLIYKASEQDILEGINEVYQKGEIEDFEELSAITLIVESNRGYLTQDSIKKTELVHDDNFIEAFRARALKFENFSEVVAAFFIKKPTIYRLACILLDESQENIAQSLNIFRQGKYNLSQIVNDPISKTNKVAGYHLVAIRGLVASLIKSEHQEFIELSRRTVFVYNSWLTKDSTSNLPTFYLDDDYECMMQRLEEFKEFLGEEAPNNMQDLLAKFQKAGAFCFKDEPVEQLLSNWSLKEALDSDTLCNNRKISRFFPNVYFNKLNTVEQMAEVAEHKNVKLLLSFPNWKLKLELRNLESEFLHDTVTAKELQTWNTMLQGEQSEQTKKALKFRMSRLYLDDFVIAEEYCAGMSYSNLVDFLIANPRENQRLPHVFFKAQNRKYVNQQRENETNFQTALRQMVEFDEILIKKDFKQIALYFANAKFKEFVFVGFLKRYEDKTLNVEDINRIIQSLDLLVEENNNQAKRPLRVLKSLFKGQHKSFLETEELLALLNSNNRHELVAALHKLEPPAEIKSTKSQNIMPFDLIMSLSIVGNQAPNTEFTYSIKAYLFLHHVHTLIYRKFELEGILGQEFRKGSNQVVWSFEEILPKLEEATEIFRTHPDLQGNKKSILSGIFASNHNLANKLISACFGDITGIRFCNSSTALAMIFVRNTIHGPLSPEDPHTNPDDNAFYQNMNRTRAKSLTVMTQAGITWKDFLREPSVKVIDAQDQILRIASERFLKHYVKSGKSSNLAILLYTLSKASTVGGSPAFENGSIFVSDIWSEILSYTFGEYLFPKIKFKHEIALDTSSSFASMLERRVPKILSQDEGLSPESIAKRVKVNPQDLMDLS